MATIKQLFRKHGDYKIAVDYMKARDLAKAEMVAKGGWGFLTDEEKNYIIHFYLEDPALDTATNDTNKVTYLMGKGLSLADASTYLRETYSMHHEKERKACLKRATSVAITDLLATYLQIIDMAAFLTTTKVMIDKFKDEGITGTEYGKAGEGITDFINDTVGTSFENLGLSNQGYVLKTGVITDLRDGLINILINGNYKK